MLTAMFEKIVDECPYKSPTDMGVNMAGNCIVDDEACREASRQEIVRRYYTALCGQRQGTVQEDEVYKLELLMKKSRCFCFDRSVVEPALGKSRRNRCPGRSYGTAGRTDRNRPHFPICWAPAPHCC